MEHVVANPAGDPVTFLHAAHAVMTKMISFDVPEQTIAKLSEMEEVAGPFPTDTALDDTREQRGERGHGKEETEGHGHEKQRQDILQLATDVPSVKGAFMVLPVKRVEPLVKKAPNHALAWRNMAVEEVAMNKVFAQSPDRDAPQIKHDPDQRVLAAQQDYRHD